MTIELSAAEIIGQISSGNVQTDHTAISNAAENLNLKSHGFLEDLRSVVNSFPSDEGLRIGEHSGLRDRELSAGSRLPAAAKSAEPDLLGERLVSGSSDLNQSEKLVESLISDLTELKENNLVASISSVILRDLTRDIKRIAQS